MASPVQITSTRLLRLIGTPAAPVLIDVRTAEDFAANPQLLPAAIRHPYDQVTDLAARLQGRSAVVYCHGGLKLSEGAAAHLRCCGIRAEVLEGGFLGWQAAMHPLIPADRIPPADPVSGGTLWVTRLRPKVDRIACAWLIRRFVDQHARFLFVTGKEVLNVADKFNATPFDIENVFWSHRGPNCTFDTMIEEFQLQTDALQRLALIVRGADTDDLTLAPQSAGLLAASLGLSRQYSDDLEQLEAGLCLYDAFYRWARDAWQEKHDWPAQAAAS